MTDPDQAEQPEISIIVVCAEGGAGIDRLLERLSDQTIAASMEVVVAVHDADQAGSRHNSRGPIGNLRFVTADLSTSARARVAAIRAARAPFVALAEDHSFPIGPNWAERLLAGLREGHAVVGPRMANANPGTATSWALLTVEYGPWLGLGDRHIVDQLPGHNSAYDKTALMSYGNRLGDMLEAEYMLHADLRRQGRSLLWDPDICSEHLNYSLPLRAIRLTFLSGWMFAASRRESWSPARRFGYAFAGPLIGLRRFPTSAAALWAVPGQGLNALRTFPMLAVLLMASGLGEMLGYAFGDLKKRGALTEMEYHRWQNLRAEELALAK